MKLSEVKQAPIPITRHRSERIDINAYPFRLMSPGDMFEVIDSSITWTPAPGEISRKIGRAHS